MLVYHVTTPDHAEFIESQGITPELTPGYEFAGKPFVRVADAGRVMKDIEAGGEQGVLVSRLLLLEDDLRGDPSWIREWRSEGRLSEAAHLCEYEGCISLSECGLAAAKSVAPCWIYDSRILTPAWHDFLCSAVCISKEELISGIDDLGTITFYEICLWALFEGFFDSAVDRVRRIWDARPYGPALREANCDVATMVKAWDRDCQDWDFENNWE